MKRAVILTFAAFCTVGAIAVGSPAGGSDAGPMAGAAAQRTYFPSRCSNSKFKPRTIVIACGDGSLYVRHIRWNTYNRHQAKGVGEVMAKTCKPYCAVSPFRSHGKGKIRLRRVIDCKSNGRLHYTRLRLRWNAPRFAINPFRSKYPCPGLLLDPRSSRR